MTQLSLLHPELQTKERILEAHETKGSHWLSLLRPKMERLYRYRRMQQGAEAFVTSVDARDAFEAMDPPGDDVLSRNFLGAVFRGSEWECVGYESSTTRKSNGRAIARWALKGGV